MFQRVIFSTIFALILAVPVIAVGPVPSDAPPSEEAFNQLQAAAGSANISYGGAPSDPRFLVARIIKIFLTLLGTIFLVIAIYAGFLWMTAGGESERVEKAKKLLYNGVLGLIIILAAYSITIFVTDVVLHMNDQVPYGWSFDVYQP